LGGLSEATTLRIEVPEVEAPKPKNFSPRRRKDDPAFGPASGLVTRSDAADAYPFRRVVSAL